MDISPKPKYKIPFPDPGEESDDKVTEGMKGHKIRINGGEVFLDDLKIRGLTGYTVQAHIDSKTQLPECKVDLSINVDLTDVQLWT